MPYLVLLADLSKKTGILWQPFIPNMEKLFSFITPLLKVLCDRLH